MNATYVHLLVHYPPKVALSKLVNSLKGVSSRRLRQEFTDQVNRAITRGRFLVPFVLRRKLRRGTADRRTPVHREPAAPRMTMAENNSAAPCLKLRSEQTRDGLHPRPKAGALAKIIGRIP
ncbi:transposase IS200-family protein [Streptomyces bingchenggensis BCW-1]|uniref:Transposase IS200-family protein n=1 Tax=Streptomyces bingchenggensis (strain BCW-1) TaxID=749414 RepID=D7C964_STRBB|nr:transposase IS200-family protein [Streptomyces bingchenggensis BCW-1]